MDSNQLWEQEIIQNRYAVLSDEYFSTSNFLKLLLSPRDILTPVLEIGCGMGNITKILCKNFINVSALDISPHALKICSSYGTHQLRLLLGNGSDLSLVESNSIGLVISHDLFQWLNAKQFASYLLESHRVLKPQGVLLFSSITTKISNNTPQSSQRFSLSTNAILNAAQAAGFCIKQVITDDTLPEETGLEKTIFELINTDHEAKPLADIIAELTPANTKQQTKILEINEIESWILLEEACTAFNRGNQDKFELLLKTLEQKSAQFPSDLSHALKALLGLRSNKAKKNNLLTFDSKKIELEYQRYFGIAPSGVDLLSALKNTDRGELERFSKLVEQTVRNNGRIFTIGNGGSFDNARAIAKALSLLNDASRTPGDGESFFNGDYALCFRNALITEKLTAADLVIGLSGSGNSPNIIEAFQYTIAQGATPFALGGRDGGQMKKVSGDARCVIAKSPCMEAIEDIHYALGLIVTESIVTKRAVADVLENFIVMLQKSLNPKNLQEISRVAGFLFNCMRESSNTFIVGSGIGANHFRADAQRGFTNGIPIRGLCAPELFTINSGMATANDDGADFLLIDGIAKYQATQSDFALLMNFPGEEKRITLVRRWLDKQKTPYITLGIAGSDIDFSPFINTFNAEFVGSLVGHATGVVMREMLWERWQVRELQGVEKELTLNGQRKLSQEDAVWLRRKLTNECVIGAHETITFCYGKVYASLDPEQHNLPYGYY